MTNFAVRKSKESRVKKYINHLIVTTFCFLFLIGSSQLVWSQDGHNHNHDSHAGHNHGDHSGHNHGSHAGHNHGGDHSGHNHGSHAGHNHGDHKGHNHGSHAGHNHGDHKGHNHDSHAAAGHGDHSSGEFNPSEVIMHHIADSHEFHLLGHSHLPLPVILYVPGKGLVSGMSSSFKGQGKSGFSLDHDVFKSKDGYEKATVMNLFDGSVKKFYDFSITKNVFTMFLAGFLLCLIFFSVARAYKKREGQAPTGLQNFMEPFFTFIRDEVAKPNIPHAWEKYLPFLMTLFFFILACNLFGLIPFFPGSANVTGNIAFTLVLAVFTFLITTFSGNKHYWQHNSINSQRKCHILICLLQILKVLN